MLDIKKLREKNLPFEKANGKTLRGLYHYDSDMVIVFDDGTFTVINARADNDYDVYFEHDDDPEVNFLHRAGIVTEEELAEYSADLRAKRIAEDERQDKEILRRLKEKYEK